MLRENPPELLKDEYFHLQEAVEKYDSHLLTIKQWSVTLSMAGIGTAFLKEDARILLLAAGSALLFWVIDGLWKQFQNVNYYRLRIIERFLNGEEFEDFRYPYITSSWGRGMKKGPGLGKVMLWSQVYLPHAAVVLLGVGLWLVGLFVPIFD